MTCEIFVLPHHKTIMAAAGENLLAVLRREGLAVDAPCGGQGKCGKCRVILNGAPALACRVRVEGNMTVELPPQQRQTVLTEGIAVQAAVDPAAGTLLAVDIGTTTVAAYLLDGPTGGQLACASAANPQASWGADVISRLQAAREGQSEAMTAAIRRCLADLVGDLCRAAGILPENIAVVSVVGNPAMQQLFFGLPTDNLTAIPFAPLLREAKEVSAASYLPECKNARLLIVPDISGFVGADTVAAVMASGMDRRAQTTLLVDIGTNGEMVLVNRGRMAACSTAAGPALEGAGIRFGMPGRTGAIDHVWLEKGELKCSVIGGGAAVGICGSGIVDAVAAALELGLLNKRGKILREDGIIPLTETVYLTQADIRQVQLAKGAIAAGIDLLAEHLGIALVDIDRVYLAGAFGTYMDPASACRIGLLQPALLDKITALGNAAGSGAQLLAADRAALEYAQALANTVEFVELAAMPRFSRCFAKNMEFTEG